jgi:hypothetical protein
MRAANSLVASGAIELMSTTVLPFDNPSATPPGAKSAFSTSGVSGTIRNTMSPACATSFADLQGLPPLSVSSCGAPERL